LLQFHKNMISALTWLSSAESKVAELDSLVESSQAEDSSDLEEVQKEMQVCGGYFVFSFLRSYNLMYSNFDMSTVASL